MINIAEIQKTLRAKYFLLFYIITFCQHFLELLTRKNSFVNVKIFVFNFELKICQLLVVQKQSKILERTLTWVIRLNWLAKIYLKINLCRTKFSKILNYHLDGYFNTMTIPWRLIYSLLSFQMCYTFGQRWKLVFVKIDPSIDFNFDCFIDFRL